ncbi:MAG: gamma-glutamyltransferase [Castellaniella sp.]
MFDSGMICAPQPEAVEAGADILRAGGNAVDAALACAFVQTVVDPFMCGIAGFGSAAVHTAAQGSTEYLDFHARAPAAAHPEMWLDRLVGETRDGFGFLLSDRANELGYQSIAVPGALKAWGELHRRHGSLPWAALIAPAIEVCRRGWLVRPYVETFGRRGVDLGRVANIERVRFSASGRDLYCRPDGTLKQIGDAVINSDYATVLEHIAREGAQALHEGELAEAVAQDMQANGGLITLQDLRDYPLREQAPLTGSYRGWQVHSNHAPGGGPLLIQMLNLLECFDLAALGHNSVDTIRIVAEAQKYATADKDAWLGDPDFFDMPLDRFLDKAVAVERAAAVRAGHKVTVPRLASTTPESPDTTHISVVDHQGNAVSMTHSLGLPSGVITDGLGFMYNGCMAPFDPRPGRAGSIAPGKARFSSICPSLLFRDGRLAMVIGAPGATQISMAVLEVILNVLDFGMSMTEAVCAPRFSATSDIIDLSYKIPWRTVKALQALGYETERDAGAHGFAAVHGIRVMADGRLDGGADPGHDGTWERVSAS